jgi:hypothetical protein
MLDAADQRATLIVLAHLTRVKRRRGTRYRDSFLRAFAVAGGDQEAIGRLMGLARGGLMQIDPEPELAPTLELAAQCLRQIDGGELLLSKYMRS